MKRYPTFIILLCILLAVPQITKAQIGYQVSLLNTATGKPQANKTVNVNIAITNAENEVVHTEIQTATTNDFGILSLSVGNEDTFKNADWNKLPFYISVSADGTLIGKSQILTVPVAEYAKTAGPVLTKEMLVGTWKWGFSYVYPSGGYTYEYKTYTFNSDGTGVKNISNHYDRPYTNSVPFTYDIINRYIYLYAPIEEILDISGEATLTDSSINYAVSDVLEFIPGKNVIASPGFLDNGMLVTKQ